MSKNNFPRLHNATWPGIVGKGPDSEPVIPFDKMLEFTAAAEVGGVKFDGVDVGLLEPHVNLEKGAEEARRLAEKVSGHGLKVGSLVAPVWGTTAMGSREGRGGVGGAIRRTGEFAKRREKEGGRRD